MLCCVQFVSHWGRLCAAFEKILPSDTWLDMDTGFDLTLQPWHGHLNSIEIDWLTSTSSDSDLLLDCIGIYFAVAAGSRSWSDWSDHGPPGQARTSENYRAVQGKKVGASAQYDWCTLTQTMSIGNREEHTVIAEPMAYAEYIKYFTQEAPQWSRFLPWVFQEDI